MVVERDDDMRFIQSKAQRLLPIVVALAVLVAASLSGCVSTSAQNSASTSKASGTPSTSISIRNTTTRSGFALIAGEAIRQQGYTYDNGYTIDVGNSAYRSTGNSMIIIQRGNEKLQAEADKLHDILGFRIRYTDDFLDYAKVVNSDNDSASSVFVILGKDDEWSNAFDKYAEEADADVLAPIEYDDTSTIVKIEPRT